MDVYTPKCTQNSLISHCYASNATDVACELVQLAPNSSMIDERAPNRGDSPDVYILQLHFILFSLVVRGSAS